jgi:DNA-binding transcriptional regulator YdaS (Cro superfamily)
MSKVSALRAYLKRHGLSQQEFATQLDVSQGMVWQWLNRRRRVTAERAKQIEQVTGGAVKRTELRPDVFAA